MNKYYHQNLRLVFCHSDPDPRSVFGDTALFPQPSSWKELSFSWPNFVLLQRAVLLQDFFPFRIFDIIIKYWFSMKWLNSKDWITYQSNVILKDSRFAIMYLYKSRPQNVYEIFLPNRILCSLLLVGLDLKMQRVPILWLNKEMYWADDKQTSWIIALW